MKTVTFSTALLLAGLWSSAPGSSNDTPLAAASRAWDAGDYVTALTTYLQILDSPDAGASLEAIALQTGELYRTTELTSDGALPRFSPQGRYVLYETGTGLSRVTRVLTCDGVPKPVAEIKGFGAVFSPDNSKLAYLKIVPTASLTEAQAAVDGATAVERIQRTAVLNAALAAESQLTVRDMSDGRESTIDTGSISKAALAFGASRLLVLGSSSGGGGDQFFEAAPGRAPVALTSAPGGKALLDVNSTGTALLFGSRAAGGGRGGRGGGASGTPPSFGVLSIGDGRVAMINGAAPAFSGDGASLTYVAREADENRIMVAPTADPGTATVVRKGPERIDAPALSRDGSRLAFQLMSRDDWEIYAVGRDGTGEMRVTREIQHDVLPLFVTNDRILAATGEPRHRRSYLYDLPSMSRRRLFHNNTVRTIAPEYSWSAGADGTKVLIAAERDGDTVSVERGVYLVDLSARVTRAELRARVTTSLEAERSLRTRGTRMYAPIAAAVKAVVAGASVHRVYQYEKALFDFDSKYVTQPGNKAAAAFLFDMYKSFGYEPEYQPFDYRVGGTQVGQTANVVATLRGTVNPELVYVVSSHYDSVAVGPGADDDSSGTSALLEAARLLAGHPQPATIVFASFTGEEAGLLGSREFVRRAVADKVKVVGALNNDMVGWANDQRLDNTIRYSNRGIRDVQHAAAMQFSNLITYDALYYKSTDAAAYYEAYGDIVGGIGSYPVLGNPHYHQPHDLLETINHQLVTEVAKTTAATLMLLASSPSRVNGLTIASSSAGSATLTWTPSPERGITAYLVAYGPASDPMARQVRVLKPSATIANVAPGTIVSVKAVNDKGMEGWDWARVTVTRSAGL